MECDNNSNSRLLNTGRLLIIKPKCGKCTFEWRIQKFFQGGG